MLLNLRPFSQHTQKSVLLTLSYKHVCCHIFLCYMTLFMFHFLCYRDDQEPFYDRSLVNGKSSLSGIRSNALMNQNWEKDLMEAGAAA